MLPPCTLVLGGAASGKSAFAESLIIQSTTARVYLATARVWDSEMTDKVTAHKIQRGPGWTTIEAPMAVAEALHQVPAGAATLIDCATMWLTNQIMAEADLDAAQAALLAGLRAAPGPVVVVSNEVGQGIVPENPLARRFRNAQGKLNQALAAEADLVVAVMAGLPLVLKGELP